MGIKNLSQFLKKHEVYETLNISTLKYTKIGIDVPMFLYKFKGVTNTSTNEWLGCFITFISFLRKWDIHPIFIFEGKAPPEKVPAQEERREQRQKMIDKTDTIERDLNNYIGTGIITDLLFEVWEKLRIKKSLLAKKTITKTKNFIDIEIIKEEINHRKRYEILITPNDINNLKELLNLMGVSWIQSYIEAETDCVSLLYDGVVDYIVSEDTDVLAYFNPINKEKELKVIINFNTTELTFTQISKQKVLNILNLTSESFRDFCIMCGTDYNKNIFRVGVEKSYKLISNCYNIENVPLDVSVLNHNRVREIFEVTQNTKIHHKVKWCRIPDSKFSEELTMFIFTFNLKNIDVDHIFNTLSQPDIEIIE